MARRTLRGLIKDLRGLDLLSVESTAEVQRAFSASNVVLAPLGGISVRKGTTRWDSAQPSGANPIRSIFQHVWPDGTEQTFATLLQLISRSTGSGWTNLKTDATTGLRYVIASGDANGTEKVYFCNGTDAIQVATQAGATTTNHADPPGAAAYCAFHANRMFWSGVAANPHRLYGSALGNADDNSTADNAFSVDIDPGQGGIIVGLMSFSEDVLIVFKERATYAMIGAATADFTSSSIRAIAPQVGCLGHWSAVLVHRRVYWWGPGGIYVFDGASVQRISDRIRTVFDGTHALALNYAQPTLVSGVHDPDNSRVLWFFPTGSSTTNNAALPLQYDVGDDEFVFWTLEAQCAALAHISGRPTVLVGRSGGYVLQANQTVYTDDGTAYAWNYDTGYVPVTAEMVEGNKLSRVIVFTSQPGTFLGELAYRTDFSTSYRETFSLNFDSGGSLPGGGEVLVWDTGLWDTDYWDAAGVTRHRKRVSSRAHHLGMRIASNTAGHALTVYGFGFAGQRRARV